MPGMSDQDDLTPALVMDLCLAVDLGDQGARGIERKETALLRFCRDRFGHPVRGKDDRGASIRNFVQFLNEYGPFALETLHDISVMHDLVPDIDGCAVACERLLDRVDGAHHARAKAPRGAQKHLERRAGAGRIGVRNWHAKPRSTSIKRDGACAPPLSSERLAPVQPA